MAIPEFILKKLIVPGSFREIQNGFSFKIMNSFAPATISRFNVRVGDKNLADEDILIEVMGLPGFTGAEVNPERPMQLPVNIEVTVLSKTPAAGEPVSVNAMTKEVGEIDFRLSPGKETKRKKELKPFFYANFFPVKKATVNVFPKQILGTASPHILGQFVEHLERCVYDGIWTSDGKRLREDTLDLIKQISPPLIRYPGGNFASGYHWEDGIGSVEKRPARHDAAWQAEESNKVGTDEFLAFCELIGAEPVLVVNDGSGTAEEAARWVAYCNNPVDSEQGARRAVNGHPAPYNVKYWGIGNEVWGPWQIGTTTPQEYARRASRFIKTMREVDPSIRIVAVGHSPLTDDPEEEGAVWNRIVLQQLTEDIDYLSWHIYQPDKADWREEFDPLELYQAVCAAPIDIERILDRVEKQIDEYAPGKNILQAVDEWNLWLPPREKNVSMHNVTYTMRDALYAASTLIAFYRRCQTVGMANLAQLVNVLPLIQTDANSAIATAMFYPFVLFSQMQSNVVRCDINSETFNSPELSINMQAHKDVPYLDALATISEDRRNLTLILVNRYPGNRLEIDLNLEQSNAAVKNSLQITSSSPGAFNSFSHPDKIRISDAPAPKFESGRYRMVLKPCSVYFIAFEIINIERDHPMIFPLLVMQVVSDQPSRRIFASGSSRSIHNTFLFFACSACKSPIAWARCITPNVTPCPGISRSTFR